MTKQEILDALENLKELTNDTGKLSIASINAAILSGLIERAEVSLLESEPSPLKEKVVKAKAPKFKSGGRFAEK